MRCCLGPRSRRIRPASKFAQFGLTVCPATKVKAPLIAECYANFECRLHEGRMDSGWIALLLRAAGLRRASLPGIWDADFLLGPRAPTGEDTYVLCEINVSGVYPIPDESVPLLVDTTIDSIRQSAAARFGLGSSGSPG